MSRPFQAFQSSFQSLPEHIKTSFATISENASPLEKSLRRATASPSAPLPSREDLIAMMNDHMTRGTSAQKESLKNFLAARQAALPALSDNAGAFLKQCPAFGTWHPLNILNEYNRINPGERAPSSTSMFLDDVGILPEKDRAAHAYRVDYLTQNWKRLDSIDRFLPMPINPTVSPLGEDDRMRLRLRHQMMDEADRISGQRPMKYTCAKQELAERRKAIEAAIKRDGEATGGDSAGAKEQATDEDWVVVNDMDAVEDPFVVVYDEAKFRKAG